MYMHIFKICLFGSITELGDLGDDDIALGP